MTTTDHLTGDSEPVRLPPGRHGLPPEHIATSQRERLHVAMVALVAEKGYTATTVQDVATRAGVSKGTFYEYFKDREECFWSANDARFTELALRVDNAYEAAGDVWQVKVRHGIAALLGFLAEEPGFAKVVFIEALALGTAGLGRRHLVLMALRSYFDPNLRPEMGVVPVERAELTAEAVVDSLAGMIFSRVLDDRVAELPSMTEDFVWIALRPYGGELD